MNARKSGERTKVWWTHESLSNARKSGHERTKVWTWTHESLVNARKSGHKRTKVWWTHESLVNARKSVERTKVWTWTHESLDMNARKSGERTKVWTWTHESLVNARRSGHERTKVWWTHESLDIGTFRLGRSGHRHFPSGTFWTYRLSVWDLNLGRQKTIAENTYVMAIIRETSCRISVPDYWTFIINTYLTFFQFILSIRNIHWN